MLSSMETHTGLTIIGPNGKQLRFGRSHPSFFAGREILRKDLPVEQAWIQLCELQTNPLQALIAWCARFGLRLQQDGIDLRLQDLLLKKDIWAPLLNRMQLVGGSPQPVLQLASQLGEKARETVLGNPCLQWQSVADGSYRLGIIKAVDLPEDARVGDRVVGATKGPAKGLVSFTDFGVGEPEDGIVVTSGLVIATRLSERDQQGLLEEPAIIGFDRTYRCEAGSKHGWMEDLSFDSLKKARLNAKDMQATGATEVRIINRISGQPVPLQ